MEVKVVRQIGFGLVGLVALAVAWYLFSPLLFDRQVDEDLAVISGDQVIGAGEFLGVDQWHQGSGQANLVRLESGDIEIRFEDFEVTNGPDLEVWLSSHEYPRTNADVTDGTWIDLGRLKGNVGNQAYILPADADLSQVQSVTIWCEQFGVLFASAPLTGANEG